MTERPQEQVAQAEDRVPPPLIGEEPGQRAETVHSSTTGSSTSTSQSRATETMLRRQEEQDEN
eukprot:858999-Amphidinium_carterae.1